MESVKVEVQHQLENQLALLDYTFITMTKV